MKKGKKIIVPIATILATAGVVVPSITSCNKEDTVIKIKNPPLNPLNVLDQYQLDVEVLPKSADQRVTYTSSYPFAADVSDTGLISVLNYDDLPISITVSSVAYPSIKTSCFFNINRPEIEVEIFQNPLSVGEFTKVVTNPAWTGRVSWEVQQVDEIISYRVQKAVLEVKGLAVGTATIIAKSTDPDYPDAIGSATIVVQ